MLDKYNCCVSKACSICCTIWCLFGSAVMTLFFMMGTFDSPCPTNSTLPCVGNFFIVGLTTNMTSKEAGEVCGWSALGYVFCTLVCGAFWIYHDRKAPKPKKVAYGVDEVEFSNLSNSLMDDAAAPGTNDEFE